MLGSMEGNNPTISGMPAGWAELRDLLSGTTNNLTVWWKQSDGTEVDFTFTTSASVRSATRTLRITGHVSATAPEVSTGATGTSTAPDPDLLNPTGAAQDILWIAFCTSDAGVISAYPTNYADNQFADGTTGADLGMATRNLNADSEDPGAFTIFSTAWCACTIAVKGAGGGGGSGVPGGLRGLSVFRSKGRRYWQGFWPDRSGLFLPENARAVLVKAA